LNPPNTYAVDLRNGIHAEPGPPAQFALSDSSFLAQLAHDAAIAGEDVHGQDSSRTAPVGQRTARSCMNMVVEHDFLSIPP